MGDGTDSVDAVGVLTEKQRADSVKSMCRVCSEITTAASEAHRVQLESFQTGEAESYSQRNLA